MRNERELAILIQSLWPDFLWDPPNCLFSGYQRFFLQCWSGQGMKLTPHLHLVLIRMC